MDKIEIVAAILIWLLIVGAALMRVPGGTGRALVAPWLALTVLAMALEFIVLNIAWFLIYFFLGAEATWVGMALSAVILAATPVVVAVILHRRTQSAATQG
jgi:hypothetical protein